MTKINLLKQKWTEKKQVRRLRLLARVVMLLSVGGFLLQTFYVTGRLVYLRTKTAKVKDEIKSVNKVLEDNSTLVENYVWTQEVLKRIRGEKEREYRYKDYLLEINSWLTRGTSLAGVSFTNKDEISFSVFAAGVDDYRRFEAALMSKQQEGGFGFRVVEQELLSRSRDGSYVMRIRLKI